MLSEPQFRDKKKEREGGFLHDPKELTTHRPLFSKPEVLLPPAIEINELIMPASNFPHGDSQHHSARLGGNGPIPLRHQRKEQIQLEDLALIYAVKRIANQRGISLLTQLNVWELG